MIAPLKTSQSSRLKPTREDTNAHAESTRLEASQPAVESIENEINRLTWTVLDGKATAEERRRLAELVAQQHNRRPPK